MDFVKRIKLNNKEYLVLQNEFNEYKHPEFTTLKLYPELSLFEREVGFLRDLTNVFDTKVRLLDLGTTHGGFTICNLTKNYEKIYTISDNNLQLLSVNQNIKDYKNIKQETIINLNKEIRVVILRSLIEFENLKRLITKDNPIILFYNDIQLNISGFNLYKIKNFHFSVYVPNQYNTNFLKEFWYFQNKENPNELLYNNLIHYTMIVKNAGEIFEEVLTRNLPFIDRWTILDTGSTDNTKEIIRRVLKDKKGTLYEGEFVDFRETRNRCLDLAPNDCKFKIMLDDTYVMTDGLIEFLESVRSDQFSNSFSMCIQSDDMEYYSNRITKSDDNLRYIYKIHEIIQKDNNNNVAIPIHVTKIIDLNNPYMKQRTIERKMLDLKFLDDMVEEEPDNPRHLYYIAQTYKTLENYEKVAEFYEKRINHPEEGFLQEKLDAIFELARTYNFYYKVKSWPEVLELYERAYNLDKTRPDCLYFIGVNYYFQQKFKLAYQYFKRAFALGYPAHAQYGLKPTLVYFFLPKYLTELCYNYKDYQLGEESSLRFLQYNQNIQNTMDYQNVLSWYTIYRFLNNIKRTIDRPLLTDRKIICFVVDGGWDKWTGSDILKRGVGGSETYIIEIARYIKKHTNYEVVVFCNCKDDEVFEGVKYIKLNKYFHYITTYEIDTLIISRYSEYLPVAYEGKVKKIYMVLHDLGPTGQIIPLKPNFKKILCLTDWHTEYFSQNFPNLRPITESFGYGVDFKYFQNDQIQKKKNTFIFSSFANRGLLQVLEMWDSIKQILKTPQPKLKIFCNLDHHWVKKHHGEVLNKIKTLLNEKKDDPTIEVKGWVSKKELGDTWLETEYWLYPCTFQETFCLTALEAAITKTVVISNDLAALQNTVGDRGLVIPGDASTPEWQNLALEGIQYLENNPQIKQHLINKNYNWAIQNSWEQRAIEFIKKYINIDNPQYQVIENHHRI